MSAQIVILAAGSSTRMGVPKQLIDWQGRPLLRHLTQQALGTEAPVMIVLGALAEDICPAVADLPVRILENPRWQEGMSSSIQLAVQNVNEDSVLLMVCDQPLVTTQLLLSMIEARREGGHAIVASRYANTLGVPALFDRTLFSELLKLEGHQGAKAIISRHAEKVHGIDFPEGEFDLDTPADLHRLREQGRSGSSSTVPD